MKDTKLFKLNEVCHVYQPETISKKSLPANGKFPVYGANGKIGLNDKFNHEEPQLLLGCRGSVGSIHISEPFSWINGNAMVVKPFEHLVIRDYLKYAFLGGINLKSAITGTAQPQITRESLAPLQIRIPTLEKQHKIVESLDNLFAEMDLLEKNLVIAAEKANQLSKSLLSVSFTPNLGSSILLDSKFSEVDKLSDIQTLGELMEFQNGRAFKSNEWAEEGLPIIRIQNLNNRNSFYNHFGGSYDERILVKNGDLLFSWSGTVGTSFGPHLWSGAEALLNQHIFKVALKPNIDKQYAYYALQSITAEIEKYVNGSVGLTHITKAKLINFKIPLPSLEEQKKIVDVLDSASREMDSLNRIFLAKKKSVTALRQSLLNMAFTSVQEVA